jgi:hypothetical protein
VTDTVDHWRQTYFGLGAANSGNAGDHASPAGDGIPNLLKYGLGLNPLLAYPPGAATGITLDSAGYLRMSVAKNPAATDLSFTIEVTSDLRVPTSWSGADTTIDENTETTLQAHDNVPISAASGRFIRLNVTR